MRDAGIIFNAGKRIIMPGKIIVKGALCLFAFVSSIYLCGCAAREDSPENTFSAMIMSARKGASTNTFYSRRSHFHIEDKSTDTDSLLKEIKLQALNDAFLKVVDDYEIAESTQNDNGSVDVLVKARAVTNDAHIKTYKLNVIFVKEGDKWKVLDNKYPES